MTAHTKNTERYGTSCFALCTGWSCFAKAQTSITSLLRRKITDSILVGFLAALEIDQECRGFDGAVLYTRKLSALVKLAQLLVVQYAVYECKAGRVQYHNELVCEMQDRFMVFGSESPMNWILNLRAYGAKARDTTTSTGFVNWSDDGQQLSYKSLELTMKGLRWFLCDQIQEAQDQLHSLLLLPEGDSDSRAQNVPELRLSSLKDDPTVCSANLSFLQDKRNDVILGGHQRHLLRQLRQDPRLRGQFFVHPETLLWDKQQIQQYMQLASTFLGRFHLLFHIAGGQPARGTELLTIRLRNSSQCDARNVFIENGMVSFMTSYHKNYSEASTTKIIHRYLPHEVGELFVY